MNYARRPRRQPRVALLGGFGGGSLGNDASLDAVIRMIHRVSPEASITCLCPRPEVLSGDFGVPGIAIRARRPAGRFFRTPIGRLFKAPYRLGDVYRALRISKSIDALLVPGTGILDDYGGEAPSGWPLTLAVWFAAARLRGAKAGFVSIGAGPLPHPVSRRLARIAGRLANYRSYRDVVSRDFMASIGVDTSDDEVVPDVVFSIEARPSSARSTGRPLVGVPVLKYGGWYRTSTSNSIERSVVEALSDFCGWLLREGYAVQLVTADGHDAPATERVEKQVLTREPDLAEQHLTSVAVTAIEELVDVLSDNAAVVASRYHSVIAALLCGKPVISLGYARKNEEVMSAVGLADYCQHIGSIDQELLRKQFSDLVADQARLSQVIASRVKELRERLGEEEKRLEAVCGL